MKEVATKDLIPVVKGGSPTGMLKFNPRCKVCNSSEEIMLMVNRMLISGSGYTEVSNAVGDFARIAGIKITPMSIKNHYEKHFNFQNKALAQIIRSRMNRNQEIENEGVNSVVDAVTAAELIMNKGVQQVLESNAVVTVTDTLNAARMVREMTRDEDSQIEISLIRAQMKKIISAVQAVCTDGQIRQIAALMDQEEHREIEYIEQEEEVIINAVD